MIMSNVINIYNINIIQLHFIIIESIILNTLNALFNKKKKKKKKKISIIFENSICKKFPLLMNILQKVILKKKDQLQNLPLHPHFLIQYFLL